MNQNCGSRKKYLKAAFAIIACFCVVCAQSAYAHPLTVWPSTGDKPLMRSDVGTKLDVWVTVPEPIFSPVNSLYGTVNATTGDLETSVFMPDGTNTEIKMLGYYNHRSPDLGLMQSGDVNINRATLQMGALDVNQKGTIVLAGIMKSSATSTIRHFSKSFLNITKDSIVTRRFAPLMRGERIEIVPMDGAEKFVKGETVRFQLYYENRLVTGEELKLWTEAIRSGDVNAVPEFNLGFAYANPADTEDVGMKEFESDDMRKMSIVNFDFNTGIVSMRFNKAALWSMEFYKPRGIEPNVDISQFTTLSFEVALNASSIPDLNSNEEKGDEKGNGRFDELLDDIGCNAGMSVYVTTVLLACAGLISVRRKQ